MQYGRHPARLSDNFQWVYLSQLDVGGGKSLLYYYYVKPCCLWSWKLGLEAWSEVLFGGNMFYSKKVKWEDKLCTFFGDILLARAILSGTTQKLGWWLIGSHFWLSVWRLPSLRREPCQNKGLVLFFIVASDKIKLHCLLNEYVPRFLQNNLSSSSFHVWGAIYR